MRQTDTILGLIHERGKKGLPLERGHVTRTSRTDAQCGVRKRARASCMVAQWQTEESKSHENKTVALESRVR